MANYNVDIEVALRGSDALRQLTNELRSVSKEVGKVNAATIKAGKASDEGFSGKRIQNVDNYSRAIAKAERTLRRAAMGTDAEKEAVRGLVRAQKDFNQELERQNKLLAEEKRVQGIKRPILSSERVSARSNIASPVMGARDIAGSPMAQTFGFEPKKAKAPGGSAGITPGKRLGAAVSAGAFPLLFGGGPGMSLGGALGGAISGSTFGPLSIALQVLGGAADDVVESTKNLGIALQTGQGVTAAYEATVGRLTATQKDYLDNLEKSGQLQKLNNETTKLANEQLGMFGQLIIDNAKSAAKFDEGASQLLNSLKALAVVIVQFPTLETFGDTSIFDVQQELTQAAKDRIITAQDELGVMSLTAQVAEKRRETEFRLSKTSIDNLAAAKTAVVVQEEQAAIDDLREQHLKGIITKKLEEAEIAKINKNLQEQVKDIEEDRLSNLKDLVREKAKAAAQDAKDAAAVAQRQAKEAKAQLKAFKTRETVHSQLSIKLLDAEITRKVLYEGQEAALKEILRTGVERLEQEKRLLAMENTALKVSLTGFATEEEINELINARIYLLEQEALNREKQTQDAIKQLQIEREIAALKATQETQGMAQNLGRQKEDLERSIASPFSTNDNEMLDLRIKQVRRFEDVQKSLNDQLKIQSKLAASKDPKVKESAESQIKTLQERIQLHETLLPQLDALEQKELKQKQLLEQIVPITSALTDGVLSVIDGTKTAEQAFADFLRSVASMLMDAASQMIATYIAIGIARAFAGMGDFNSAAASPGGSAGVKGIGGGMTNPFGNTNSFGTFAEGGVVNKPTNALIGEGGEPEYVIPASKMRESMSRYSRGSRGAGVIPDSSGGSAGEDGGVAVAAPIDVRYTVERINSVDYVTADQFQSGMRQAADQGAKQGEQQTLKRLQMSSGTRKRLGM